jgi:hypothetical protein
LRYKASTKPDGFEPFHDEQIPYRLLAQLRRRARPGGGGATTNGLSAAIRRRSGARPRTGSLRLFCAIFVVFLPGFSPCP